MSCGLFAQSDTTKANYHLFKPTPKEKMREMATDRPDITESAYSVDAGHIQYETDLFKTERLKEGDLLLIQNQYNQLNFKLGLTNSIDLQFLIQSVVTDVIKDKASGLKSSSSAFGDVGIRLKKNLWGNDGGKSALALMSFVNIPTSKSSVGLNGGLIAPFALKLSEKLDFGAQVELHIAKSEVDDKYHPEFLNSFTLNHKLSKKLELFTEAFYTIDFKTKKLNTFLDAGLIFVIIDNFNVDAGVNYGVTKNSNKVYFTGLSFRY